jgi:uncharacterized protein YeaC (DUF1315 family)
MNGNSFNLIVHGLPDEVYSEFKRGYWRNGMLLTAKQKEAAQRAILVRETQTTAALQ